MLSPGNNDLLIVSEDQIEYIRKSYHLTPDDIEKHVDSIIEWFNLQTYSSLLQEPFDRYWVERFFISNKCSIEKTKNKLKNYYTSLHNASEFFENRDPAQLVTAGRHSVYYLPLRRLTPDGNRVFIVSFRTSDTKHYDLLTIKRNYFMIQQYRQIYDYALGCIFVCDFRKLTFKHVLKSSPFLLKKVEYIDKNILANRIAAIHIISDNWLLKYVLAMANIVFPAKLQGRIKVHPTLETLYENIPKEILPADYGGEDKIFEEQIDDWETELCTKEQREFNKAQDHIIQEQRKGVINKK